MPLSGLARAWVLARPGVSIVLAGARSSEQVDQNLAGTQHLAPSILQEIDEIVAAACPPAGASDDLKREAATRGGRERFIVERLDGTTRAETTPPPWTEPP